MHLLARPAANSNIAAMTPVIANTVVILVFYYLFIRNDTSLHKLYVQTKLTLDVCLQKWLSIIVVQSRLEKHWGSQTLDNHFLAFVLHLAAVMVLDTVAIMVIYPLEPDDISVRIRSSLTNNARIFSNS